MLRIHARGVASLFDVATGSSQISLARLARSEVSEMYVTHFAFHVHWTMLDSLA